MDSRIATPVHDEISVSISYRFTSEVVKIGMVGLGVATIFLPGDFLMHILQTQKSNHTLREKFHSVLFRFTRTTMSFTALLTLARIYSNSVQAATLKNSVIGQRQQIGDLVASKSGTDESLSVSQSLMPAINELTFLQSIVVAMTIGTCDTTITHFNYNKRALHMTKLENPDFQVPMLHTFADYGKLYQIGYCTRILRNAFSVSGFILSSKIYEQIKDVFPKTNYFNPGWLIATISTGSTVGLIVNVFDILYRYQIANMSVQFHAPSMGVSFIELVQKQGYKGFKRGSLVAIGYSSAAQLVIPFVEGQAEKLTPIVLPKLEKLAKKFLLWEEKANQDRYERLDLPDHFCKP